ncbi:MAG: N-acetylneuraminate synthase [Magnetococcales bacterium]|nr:N-acetylneuraminate synthase [Magnetococcales bacterium]
MNNTYIIAEAGVNHNGSLDRAMDMVDCAAAAGANAVKFQTFIAENLVTAQAPKAHYQQQTTGSGSQLSMLKQLELTHQDHFALARRCGEQGIEFLSTPFDIPSLHFLVASHLVRRIKIPSGELTHGPLLYAAAQTGHPLIVSTGMADPDEIGWALRVIVSGWRGDDPAHIDGRDPFVPDVDLLRGRVTLLHCTTSYPTPMEAVNLSAMVTLRQTFHTDVGYSDHTRGITIPIAAVALGAMVIEKHFTLDRNLEGPDHRASLEPDELTAMVQGIRQVERAMGDGIKRPDQVERGNAAVARKSVHASRFIPRGALFTADNLAIKRPGTGRSPQDYWRLLGTTASKDYDPDDPID